jgi:carbamoyl-phosphate synthase/aspartate carbamoyltransferase/dihydroorotase
MILPGLIDAHVHLRAPGGEHKEDFRSGTRAALAGGFTTVLAMPNTRPPLVSVDAFRIAQKLANSQSLCDVFLYAGASADHIDELPRLANRAVALKIYMDDTYGPLKVRGLGTLERIFASWPENKLICLHAEEESVAVGVALAAVTRKNVHFCHISRREEIEMIAFAKSEGLPVTCEVTPHHLYLTYEDGQRLGPYGDMRPRLQTQDDVDALWEHINTTIDIISSDHAPHTREEKGPWPHFNEQTLWDNLEYEQYNITASTAFSYDRFWRPVAEDVKQSEPPEYTLHRSTPPGVPGLESTLPLMLTAAAQKRLTYERLVELLCANPRRIFNLPEQHDTWVEVDEKLSYTFPLHPLQTKCGWSPFEGMRLIGAVQSVTLRGRKVVKDGLVLEQPESDIN